MLLNFNLGSGLFELAFEGFGFILGHAFFDGLGCLINQGFGFFQSETGEFFHQFYYGEFGAASAFEDNVKFGLLFGSFFAAASAGGTCYYGRGRSGFNAVLVFEVISQFIHLFYGEVYELIA